MRRISWLAAFLVACFVASVHAQEQEETGGGSGRQPGVWVKDGEPVQTVPGMPLACRQRYLCNAPNSMIISDQSRLRTTAAEVVNGACSVGSGNVEECNVCLSNPPATPCEWWIEQAS